MRSAAGDRTPLGGDQGAHDESALMHAMRDGDEQAFGEVVRRYQARLRGLVARYLDDGDTVLDVVQESFVNAWKARDRLQPELGLWPWLRTIAQNKARDELRRLSRSRERSRAELDDQLFRLLESRADDDRLEYLQTCLEQLPERQRSLLRWRWADMVPVQLIATRLKTSANAVSMRLQRLHRGLRRCIEQHMSGSGS